MYYVMTLTSVNYQVKFVFDLNLMCPLSIIRNCLVQFLFKQLIKRHDKTMNKLVEYIIHRTIKYIDIDTIFICQCIIMFVIQLNDEFRGCPLLVTITQIYV